MEFRIGFKINFDLLQNSIAFRFKRKVKGKGKVRKKDTKEEEFQLKYIYIQTAHKRNSELIYLNYIKYKLYCLTYITRISTAFSHLV